MKPVMIQMFDKPLRGRNPVFFANITGTFGDGHVLAEFPYKGQVAQFVVTKFKGEAHEKEV